MIVRSIDDRITVIAWSPDRVTVQLDDLVSRRASRSTVDARHDPRWFGTGKTTVDPTTVIVVGAGVGRRDGRRRARRRRSSRRRGSTSTRTWRSTAGRPARGCRQSREVEPDTARVNYPGLHGFGSRAVPVSPVVTGTPAAGFEVATITVDPTDVTVKGDAERLAALESVDTEPVSVTGASDDGRGTVELDSRPTIVAPLDGSTVEVTITLRPVTSTRELRGRIPVRRRRQRTCRYAVRVDRVLVTIGGSAPTWTARRRSALVADLDVGDLGPGTSGCGGHDRPADRPDPRGRRSRLGRR